jgi:hypothetical protein
MYSMYRTKLSSIKLPGVDVTVLGPGAVCAGRANGVSVPPGAVRAGEDLPQPGAGAGPARCLLALCRNGDISFAGNHSLSLSLCLVGFVSSLGDCAGLF